MQEQEIEVLNAVGALVDSGVKPPYTPEQIFSQMPSAEVSLEAMGYPVKDRSIGKKALAAHRGSQIRTLERLIRKGLLFARRRGNLVLIYPSSETSTMLGNPTKTLMPIIGRMVPRESLSTPTKRNLDILEKQGFKFEDKAERIEVPQDFDTVHSYVIKGVGPEGESVVYDRHETRTPGAGQTYLKTPYGRVRASALLHGEPVEGSSVKAAKHYLGPVKSLPLDPKYKEFLETVDYPLRQAIMDTVKDGNDLLYRKVLEIREGK